MTINPIEIAKDIINLGATAGVKKDVIDLQAAKLRILTDELAAARIRATQFELDYNNLKAQLERLHPVQKPADTCPFCRRARRDDDWHPVMQRRNRRVRRPRDDGK